MEDTRVSISLVETLFNNMKGKVEYGYGIKAPYLACDSHNIHKIDCSGWSRYAVAKGSEQHLIIPDGSQVQLEYAAKHWRKLKEYKDVAYAKEDPSKLCIAFLRVTPYRDVGHVWLVYMGMTMESHGHVGIDSRPWNTHVLMDCYDCFQIPSKE